MRYEPVGMRMPVVSRWLSYNQCEISLCAVRLSETNPPLKFQFSPVIAIYTARTAIFVGVLSQSYSIFRLFFGERKIDISWRRRVLILRIDGISILTKDYYQLLLSENLKISGQIGLGRVGSGRVLESRLVLNIGIPPRFLESRYRVSGYNRELQRRKQRNE